MDLAREILVALLALVMILMVAEHYLWEYKLYHFRRTHPLPWDKGGSQ